MLLQQREVDIRDELIQWGHWASCLGLSFTMTTKSNRAPQITDDRAMAIDRVIAILSMRDKLAGMVLKSTYIQCYTIREIAKRYDMKQTKVHSVLNMAVNCVAMGLAVQASANDDKY